MKMAINFARRGTGNVSPNPKLGPQVKSEDALYVVFLENAFFADIACSACSFLCRLKYQKSICQWIKSSPSEKPGRVFILVFIKYLRKAEQHGHMPVMTACVHPAFVI